MLVQITKAVNFVETLDFKVLSVGTKTVSEVTFEFERRISLLK